MIARVVLLQEQKSDLFTVYHGTLWTESWSY